MHSSTNIPARRVTSPLRLARRWKSLAAAALVLCAAGCLPHQQAAGQTVSPETVVATIGDEPIRFGEVIGALRGRFAGREIPPAARPEVVARTLDALIRQKLITRHIEGTETEVTEAELGELLDSIKGQIVDSGITYKQFLEERGMTDATLREQLTSDILWQNFSEERLTDEALKTFFDEHHTEFDGSEMRLGHILFRSVGDIAGGQEAATEKANQIRQQLVDGAVDFADAARRNSDAPSRHNGGDLGYMKRDAPWDAKFMKVAFALAEDELSEAISTQHGVHLIFCKDIRRGFKTFDTTRKQVQAAAVADLRKTIVEQERARTPVVFTAVVPYVDLDTEEIVTPEATPAADTP